MTAVIQELDFDGPAAPPRANGELVFDEPWQGRAFGLAMALTEHGVVPYDDFRDRLIARIAAWEADPPPGEPYRYYAHWLQALEDVLGTRDLVSDAEVQRRAVELSDRPPGHDHSRDDGYDHDDDH